MTNGSHVQTDQNRRLDKALQPFYSLSSFRAVAKCPSLRLQVALVSVACVIVFLSACVTDYGTIGESSENQLAPDSYRASFVVPASPLAPPSLG
jgi:hypothetical protein